MSLTVPTGAFVDCDISVRCCCFTLVDTDEDDSNCDVRADFFVFNSAVVEIRDSTNTIGGIDIFFKREFSFGAVVSPASCLRGDALSLLSSSNS